MPCTHQFAGNTLVLFLDTCGDNLIVGDLMKSVNVLTLQESIDTLVEEARDPASAWVTELKALRPDAFLVADGEFNFFMLQRNLGSLHNETRARLDYAGYFHVGDLVNVMVPGTLVRGLESSTGPAVSPSLVLPASGDGSPDKTPSSSTAASSSASAAGPAETAAVVPMEARDVANMAQPSMLFGTVHGMLGAILTLPPSLYRYLKRAEAAVERTLKFVGEFSHEHWRGWYNEESTYAPIDYNAGSQGFIDGDLLELLLELGPAQIEEVVKAMNADTSIPVACLHPDGISQGPAVASELVAVIEELSRKH